VDVRKFLQISLSPKFLYWFPKGISPGPPPLLSGPFSLADSFSQKMFFVRPPSPHKRPQGRLSPPSSHSPRAFLGRENFQASVLTFFSKGIGVSRGLHNAPNTFPPSPQVFFFFFGWRDTGQNLEARSLSRSQFSRQGPSMNRSAYSVEFVSAPRPRLGSHGISPL